MFEIEKKNLFFVVLKYPKSLYSLTWKQSCTLIYNHFKENYSSLIIIYNKLI